MTTTLHRAERITLPASEGLSLAADRRGEGRRLAMLLHGGGQTRHSWDETARALAHAGWVSVSVDQRGHGESDRSPDGRYSPLEYAADATAVAKALTGTTGARPVAIGASLGGMASLLAEGMAAERGEALLAGLVLVDITPRMAASGVEKIQGFMKLHAAEGFASLEEAAEAVAAYLPHRPRPPTAAGLAKNLRKGPDGRYRWHWDPRFLVGPRHVSTDWENVRDRMEEAARRLAIPTLLVRGGSSELVQMEHVAAFRALAPHAEFIDVSGARHMVAGDKNDVFRKAILDFLGRRFG